MSALSPEQFFHGTVHDIKDGVVRPAADMGKDISDYSSGDPGDMSNGDHAFAVRNDERYAWHAASTFHGRGEGRPRVYEVSPATDMKPGPWNKEHPDFLHHVEYGDPKEYPPHENPEAHAEALENHQDEWASKIGFPVRKRVDIMPNRQGTFSQINWNDLKRPGASHALETNHPDHEQVTFGMLHTSNLREAYQINAEIDKVPEPKRRSGASLRAFMEGKPAPTPPLNRNPTLF